MEENKAQVEESQETETNPEPTAEEQEQEEPSESAEASEQEPKAKVYTEEEVQALIDEKMKKKQSDVDKGVQKLIQEAKFKDAVIDAVKKVSADNAALVEMYETDPRVAKEILKTYYDGQSIEDYKAAIGYKEDLSDPKVYKRKIELETEKRLDAVRIENAKNSFIEKLQMSDDEKAEFEQEFQERRELKTFTAADVEKHLEKAYRAIDKTDRKELKKQEVVAKSTSTGISKSSGSDKKQEENEYAAFLKKFKVLD